MTEMVKITLMCPDGAVETFRAVVQDHGQLDRFIRDSQWFRGKPISLVERRPFVTWTSAAWPWANLLERIK